MRRGARLLAFARCPRRASRQVQVAPEHYDFERYDDRRALDVVLAPDPRRARGPAAGPCSRSAPARACSAATSSTPGVTVKTLDIDASRGVDYVADITRLDETLPAGLMFDAVCAFQVLEHLPLAELETCLAGLARRANPHVFISLPYRGLRIRWSFWWGDHHLTLGHKFMLPWRHKPIPEHHWELGYPLTARKITRRIATQLDVVSRGFVRENPYHYMWQLRRRGALGTP